MTADGTPKTPAAIAASVFARSACLTAGVQVGERDAAFGQQAAERVVVGRQVAVAPDEREQPLHDLQRVPEHDRQPEQSQRNERVHRRKRERDAVRVREPGDVLEGPAALGRDLGRTGVPEVLEQPGEQHRPARDARLRGEFAELRALQVGERRDEVEVPLQGSVAHDAAPSSVK